MRYSLVPLLIMLSAVLRQAQSGPCTEIAVKKGNRWPLKARSFSPSVLDTELLPP
jgi:hypothetical protein